MYPWDEGVVLEKRKDVGKKRENDGLVGESVRYVDVQTRGF